MTKLKYFLILALAIGGALLIYNHFSKKNEQVVEINKFTSEYPLVEEDNIYTYKNIDEVINTLESGTGIIFMCTPSSKWCQYYALYLNEVAKANNVTEVYYSDIKDDRNLNTVKYQKLLTILEQYLYKDDLEDSKLYMPDLTFVKNGVIITHDNETSLVASDLDPETYWNNEKKNEFENKIKTYIDLMNE